MGFLPASFQLVTPFQFILDLGSGTGQTDRRRPLKLYAPTLGRA